MAGLYARVSADGAGIEVKARRAGPISLVFVLGSEASKGGDLEVIKVQTRVANDRPRTNATQVDSVKLPTLVARV